MREAWQGRKISPCLGATGSGINDCKSEAPRVSSTSILPWMAQGSLQKPQFQPTPSNLESSLLHSFTHSCNHSINRRQSSG